MIFWFEKNHFLMTRAAVAWATFAFVASLFGVVTMTLIASTVMLFGGFLVMLFAVLFGGFLVVLFVSAAVVLFGGFLAMLFGGGSSDNDTSNWRGDCCGGFDTLFVGAFGDFEDIAKRGSRIGVHSGFNVLHPFIHIILYV